jgi:Holin of 3TMs, for gene-transfer release
MSLDPITALLDIGKTALDKFIPDPQAKAQAVLELEKLHAAGDSERLSAQVQLILAQTEINKVEAASTSVFVAGWRPFIGWVCGTALAYDFIVEPFLRFTASVLFGYSGAFPIINTDALSTVLMGMLGLGAMRTVEKIKGV